MTRCPRCGVEYKYNHTCDAPLNPDIINQWASNAFILSEFIIKCNDLREIKEIAKAIKKNWQDFARSC